MKQIQVKLNGEWFDAHAIYSDTHIKILPIGFYDLSKLEDIKTIDESEPHTCTGYNDGNCRICGDESEEECGCDWSSGDACDTCLLRKKTESEEECEHE